MPPPPTNYRKKIGRIVITFIAHLTCVRVRNLFPSTSVPLGTTAIFQVIEIGVRTAHRAEYRVSLARGVTLLSVSGTRITPLTETWRLVECPNTCRYFFRLCLYNQSWKYV